MTDLIEGYDLHLQSGYVVVKVCSDIDLANPVPVELVQGNVWFPSPEQVGYICEIGSILLANTTEGITIQREGESIMDVIYFMIPTEAIVGKLTKKEDNGS
jgi:hypothetical protein